MIYNKKLFPQVKNPLSEDVVYIYLLDDPYVMDHFYYLHHITPFYISALHLSERDKTLCIVTREDATVDKKLAHLRDISNAVYVHRFDPKFSELPYQMYLVRETEYKLTCLENKDILKL